MFSRAVTALVAALCLSACVAAQEAPPEPSFPALPADAPAGTGATQPCLAGLGPGLRCGRYRVFEDRASRRGRTIDLAFVVADGLDPAASAADAVTFLLGGPGASAIDGVAMLVPAWAEVRGQRDLLFVDHRGVRHSGALTCDVPYPGGVESRFPTLFPLDFAAACRDHLGRRARLDLYTTEHTMDDLDELRGWLGYESLDFVAYSYGTREAQVYLRRHPRSVRVVALSGVVPAFAAGYVTHARLLQQALDELVAECGRDPRCVAAYPDLLETVESVLARVRRDPPLVVAEGRSVRFGHSAFGYAMRGLLYRRAAELPGLVYQAAAGDFQPLADYYLDRTRWIADPGGVFTTPGMHLSVLCAEDMARLDDTVIARETGGTFLGDSLIRSYVDVCALWPHARLPTTFWEPVASGVPILLISGSRDPVTPPANAEAVARHLSASLHVVFPGAGHVPMGACALALQRQLIERGSVQGLDTSCVNSEPATRFVVPTAAVPPSR
jgi:pimeloyl-ACP methyl ester carboxylesterase